MVFKGMKANVIQAGLGFTGGLPIYAYKSEKNDA